MGNNLATHECEPVDPKALAMSFNPLELMIPRLDPDMSVDDICKHVKDNLLRIAVLQYLESGAGDE